MTKKRITMQDLALGSYEAACIIGAHWTQPGRLAKAGRLVYRPLESGWGIEGRNEFFLYSLADCDENYRDYIAAMEAGGVRGRPRGQEYMELREPMLARLAAVEPILYDDAIGTAEAARILGVHITLIGRMIRSGKIRGRIAINDRKGRSSVYIVSRRSCEENRAVVMASEAAGTKTGRKRKPSGTSPKVIRKAPVARKRRPKG